MSGDGQQVEQVEVGEATARRLAELEQELGAARQTIEQLERRQKIDTLLAESEAVDLEAARLLTERAVAEMDEPDVAMAVEDLRRHRPWLFSGRRGSGSVVMPARLEPEAEGVEHAATRAAQSGQRRDLLAYLRMRRRGGK